MICFRKGSFPIIKNGLILPWLNVPGQLEEGHRTTATAFDDMEDEVFAAAIPRSAHIYNC